jgi:two-component system, cell cycle sensor histidine kinase and response regulator CckA
MGASREEFYLKLFAHHPLPTWVLDAETYRFLEVNDAAVRHYGWSREEFLAMTALEIRPPEDIPDFLDALETVSRHASHLARHRKKDGSIIWVEASGHAFELDGRKARLVVIYDVTARRAAENQVRQLQKMEAVGLLAGGIAHDFNNVLTAIQAHADFAGASLPAEHPARADVQEILRAARQAAGLTQRLLTFSRRTVIDPQPIDLNRTIVELQHMLRRLIGEDIALRTVPRARQARIRADRGDLEQVLLNLAVNARDAISDGGTLVIETADLASGMVRLSVTDNGVGMDAATATRIFEPFFTTKEPGKGTGLGLSTVYGIVQQSGGQIQVISEPGQGTTFQLDFPVDASPPVTVHAVAHPVIHAVDHEAVILLAEDDDLVRTAVRITLEHAGFTVLEARDGLDGAAVAGAHGGAIDVLLSDMVMPGQSGPDLAAGLLRSRPDLKVLFMSGYTDRSVVREGLLAGAGFIEKPFLPDAIVAKIRALL